MSADEEFVDYEEDEVQQETKGEAEKDTKK